MERSYQLEPNEQQELAGLETERTQTLAQVGALMLDLETAKAKLTSTTERQQAFVRRAVASRNIQQFENASVGNGHLQIRLADEPMLPAPPAPATPASKLNGAPAHAETE